MLWKNATFLELGRRVPGIFPEVVSKMRVVVVTAFESNIQ